MTDHATTAVYDESDVIRPETSLAGLRFDNRFLRRLPADPETGPRLRQVAGAAYSRVRPVVAADPRILAWSRQLSDQLGLDDEVWGSEEAALVFTGSRLLPGSDPHAVNYGGHQFGNWAGQLGDGRAIALGEVVDRNGVHQTLQLKGAGPTPYSRRADGLAVLRSSIREFVCSEAMFHLGVPTTRALSLATTGRDVVRDMFYDGNPRPEPGAVVCRVAPSFLRFGNYQIFAARQELGALRQLVDFTVETYFPHLGPPSPEVYAAWFGEVSDLTCALVIEWMRVGFVHGVMNTDNMSIHGLTIDYGPYGWLDDFDPGWTPNTTDAGGRRYRYGQQPQVAQWNLVQLANAVYPLVGEAAPFEAALDRYARRYHDGYRAMMLDKLGVTAGDEHDDDRLVAGVVEALTSAEIDMTLFFRRLADLPAQAAAGTDPLAPEAMGKALYQPPSSLPASARTTIDGWLRHYLDRVAAEGRDGGERAAAMHRVNPLYVFRNYLAQQVIDAAEAGDAAPIGRLLDVLRHPYEHQDGADGYAAKRPEWARDRPGCSMLSCSS
ncbi:MAG: YdiU family protein [Acidimicrobiales bacterium]